jgi:four helix bundle protein
MHTTIEPILPNLARLAVYRKALTTAGLVLALPLQGSLRDQMHRATESLVLCIAEGAGERTWAAKARYYTIAKASLWELSAALDLLALRRGPSAEIDRIGGLLREVDAMLASLARKR